MPPEPISPGRSSTANSRFLHLPNAPSATESRARSTQTPVLLPARFPVFRSAISSLSQWHNPLAWFRSAPDKGKPTARSGRKANGSPLTSRDGRAAEWEITSRQSFLREGGSPTVGQDETLLSERAETLSGILTSFAIEKGKPVERPRRKATGLRETHI